MRVVLNNDDFISGWIDKQKTLYLTQDHVAEVEVNDVSGDETKFSDCLDDFLEKSGSGFLKKHYHFYQRDATSLIHSFILVKEKQGCGLVSIPEQTIYLQYEPRNHRVTVVSGAKTPELCKTTAIWLANSFPYREIPEDPDIIPFRFWYVSAHGKLSYKDRDIACPKLSEISDNYDEKVISEITRLSTLPKPYKHGKIILWHGLPGTGKTYCIRALARELAENFNASIEFILDANDILGSAGVVTQLFLADVSLPVVKKPPEESGSAKKQRESQRLRLIIVEDKADMFSMTGHCRENPAFSTLLNIADGLIGQGLPIVFLFTANEKVVDFDPAIKRSGRCLSQTEFDKLSMKKSNEWLKKYGVEAKVEKATTIADLYALLNNVAIPKEDSSSSKGIGF